MKMTGLSRLASVAANQIGNDTPGQNGAIPRSVRFSIVMMSMAALARFLGAAFAGGNHDDPPVANTAFGLSLIHI